MTASPSACALRPARVHGVGEAGVSDRLCAHGNVVKGRRLAIEIYRDRTPLDDLEMHLFALRDFGAALLKCAFCPRQSALELASASRLARRSLGRIPSLASLVLGEIF